LLELQELNEKISDMKPDNSEVVKLLTDLITKIELLDLKPEIKVESKEVKVEPKIDIKPPEVNLEVNQEKVVEEIKSLSKVINLDPNLKTNQLISDLINKISELELKPVINVESKEVTVSPVFDPKIEVKPAEVKISKTDVSTPIKWLYKAVESVLSNFFGKVVVFMNKILNYIREPDKIIVTDYEMTEYYGNQKVTYKIKDDGSRMEISRES